MTEAAYDAIAAWYDQSLRKNGGVALTNDLIRAPLFELMGDVRGQYVCDLACGQGLVARDLARRGASVVGVDIAGKLLAIAEQIEQDEPLGVVYLQDDAQVLARLDSQSFDGVACNMALMDIPDLDALCRAIVRVLRPNGWFVCSITHPCFQTPNSLWVDGPDGEPLRTVSHYFNQGFWRSNEPNGVRGQVGAYHRTLATYLNTFSDAGLMLERTAEPQAYDAIAHSIPGYRVVAPFLLMRCRRAT